MHMKTIASSFLALLLLAFNIQALADPPDQSGPNVTRFDGGLFDFRSDEKSGLTAALGGDPREACNFDFDFDEVSYKDIDVPSADERIVGQFSGYVRAFVWEGLLPDPFDFFANCEFFFAADPLATGMVKINGTDNDIFVFEYENTNRNAFGWNAHGTLYDYMGDGHVFHLTFRANWDGNDEESFSEKVKISLK